jgi:hypothetical protein
MADRDQPVLEGPIGEGGWRYRTARMPGHIDFFPPNGQEAQAVEAAGGPITEVRPLSDTDDREVLLLTEKTERIYRRGDDDIWRDEGVRLYKPS